MRRIAQEVGVQAGALYNYTPDKQSLLFDLMQGHMDELLIARDREPNRKTPQENLEAFSRFHIRFHLERPLAVFISYMELRNLTPENFATIEDLRRRYEGELEAILCDGKDTGVFNVADTKITTLAIIAMLNGVNTWYRSGGRLSLPEVEAIYWDMVRKAVT
jgi:AcrR family transcriptional regulator